MGAHWLVKSEPGTYSIDDLARDRRTAWDGVRNYQARNLLRDRVRKGDLVLFYHSNAEPPCVAGLAKVLRGGHPEREAPWVQVELGFVRRLPRAVPLSELRADPRLRGMELLRRGSRLSVQPVAEAHFRRVLELAGA